MRDAALEGLRFGKLKVVYLARTESGRAGYFCLCDCGNSKVIPTGSLTSGRTQSCGCIRSEVVSKAFKTHGMYGTPTYKVWHNMLQRCTNPNNTRYADWGGRGIKVCERWSIFENFFADMGVRPEGLTIDRIDNDGDYCPTNCKWSNQSEQTLNSRRYL